MATKMAIDTELLITEVQKRPTLWDNSDDNFKDKNKKNSVWREVCSCLLSNFDNETDAQQHIIVLEAISKWRTIRDNYTRSLKKQAQSSQFGSAAKRTKLYIYADQLAFLNKSKELRPSQSNIKDENDESGEYNSTYGTEGEADEGGESRDVPHYSTSCPTRETPVRKNKKPDVERVLRNFMANHEVAKNPLDDDDLAFFYSLLPTLKTLNFEQKFSFRQQSMQILVDLKNSQINNYSSHTGMIDTPATSFINMRQSTLSPVQINPVTFVNLDPSSIPTANITRSSSASSKASSRNSFNADL